MIPPTYVLKEVKAGHGHESPYDARSFLEYLADFVEYGLVDQEEAHCAIIKGNKRERVERALFYIQSGTGPSDSREDAINRLIQAVNEGDISKEKAHSAFVEGTRNRPKYVLEETKDGFTEYAEELTELVKDGSIDQEKARLAITEGKIANRVEDVIKHIVCGHEHLRSKEDEEITYREELKQLVEKGLIDQEEAHLALCRGRELHKEIVGEDLDEDDEEDWE